MMEVNKDSVLFKGLHDNYDNTYGRMAEEQGLRAAEGIENDDCDPYGRKKGDFMPFERLDDDDDDPYGRMEGLKDFCAVRTP